MRSPERRWLVAAVVAVVAGAVGFFVLDGDGGESPPDGSGSGIDPADVLSEDQVERIRQTRPDPGCVGEDDPTPANPSLVALDVVRVDGTCLTTTTEYVAEDRADDRRAAVEREPGVIAAAVVAPPSTDQAEDDRRDDQWALDLLGAPEDSPELPWPDGTGTVVAVLDSGVDSTHPDLGDAVVARRSFPGEAERDYDGHGTHVAGIIGARRGNGGIVGVAPAAQILDVPIYLKGGDKRAPSWPVGLTWAVNHGADVANLSFGRQLSKTDRETLEVQAAAMLFAQRGDVVVIAAAGNCGCDERQVPSAFEWAVSVGALQSDHKLGGYSTRVDVDLVAPGGGDLLGGVLSTTPDGGYRSESGTSQAAPHVAAAVAVARFVDPEAPAERVVRALRDTADLDRVDEGQRSDPGVGRGLLDIAGLVETFRTAPAPEPGDPADRTQATFVQDGTLFAFDGTTSHPVRRLAPDASVSWVEWSADHTQLVGADDAALFSWAGPGREVVETPCDHCPSKSLAYLDDVVVTDPGEGERTGDLVVGLDLDGTLTRFDAHTLEQLGTATVEFPAAAVGSMTLHGDVDGLLVVHESGGAQASERLWLVDPVAGRSRASQEMAGAIPGRIAVPAAGDRVALVGGYTSCDISNEVYVLDGEDLTVLARPDTPPDLIVDELFFNGDALYATMTHTEPVGHRPCIHTGSGGLWRLDDRSAWQQVDPRPVRSVRPLEGLTGASPTGRLAVSVDGNGFVEPAGTPGDTTDLGPVDGPLWATPTRTEVDMSTPAPTACEAVVFEPNTDNGADGIQATGVSCEQAETLLRAIAEQTSPVGGDERVEAEGYVCERTALTTDPLPSAEYRCTRGTAVIAFTRT